eukprot:gene14090-biopygen14153
MGIHANTWTSMEIQRNPWGSMQIHGNPWQSGGIHGTPCKNNNIVLLVPRIILGGPRAMQKTATTWVQSCLHRVDGLVRATTPVQSCLHRDGTKRLTGGMKSIPLQQLTASSDGPALQVSRLRPSPPDPQGGHV